MSTFPALSAEELHLLYVLLDSNLPTGGFVSSSGLESFAKHGFLSIPSHPDPYQTKLDQSSISSRPSRGLKEVTRGVVGFAEAEVRHYASTTCCFVKDSWELVNDALKDLTKSSDSNIQSFSSSKKHCSSCKCTRSHIPTQPHGQPNGTTSDVTFDLDDSLREIQRIDEYHEATLLSHVARRASKAQGVAMLTLYTRGLSQPAGTEQDLPDLLQETISPNGDDTQEQSRLQRVRDTQAKEIINGYKRMIRRGEAPGHLAVCWGVITAALGLNLDRALHLHLFLHARSLLSTAVRLNLIGPYASSQLLLHPFRQIIEDETISKSISVNRRCSESEAKGFWDWTDEAESGPATTWPLGEVLMGRHDMQHSRIFNS